LSSIKELYNSLLNNDYSNIKVNEKYKRDKDGNTLLHYAVKDANFEMVQDLIKLGCCPIIPNFNMETPLILSALSENFNIFKFLIKEFNDILLKEEKNEILAISVSSGNIYHVRLLLEMNYDPNVFYRNTPIILWGVESESTDIIKILCDKNTNLNLADEDGMSALYEASAKGLVDIVSLLLKHGANKDIASNDGTTPLIIASCYNQSDVVNLLLHHNANIEAKTKKGMTALLYAVSYGNIEIVKALLDAGANIKVKDYKERGIDFYARKIKNKKIKSNLLKLLNIKDFL
jgi:ankyrin repeat protein